MSTIDMLNVGDIAYDNISEYARVYLCVHGNKYYAYIYDNDNISSYYVVSDMDDNHIPCCG